MEGKEGFGKYIRVKRIALDFSQRELADRLYVTESAVSKWERGVSYPDITQITPLCEVLGVSEHELVTASDDWRQHKIEREAAAHRKLRAVWLWGLGICYVAILVGNLLSTLNAGNFPGTVVVAFSACLFCASFTHVPILIQDSPVLVHKGFVVLGVSTVAFMMTIVAAHVEMGVVDVLFFDLAMALYLVAIVWIGYLVLRYLPTELPFRLALFIASLGLWLFLLNAFVSLLSGESLNLHSGANFTDWATQPAVNDNICWILLLICLVAALAFCFVGILGNRSSRWHPKSKIS